MPNWVYNRLEVLGDPDELAALVAEVQSDRTQDGVEPEVLDFARIVPIPESLEAAASPALQPGDIGEDGAMPAWRQWRVEHWGTKWNAMYARREGDSGGGRVVYRFSTAYSTPEPWLAAISRSYPTLAFVHEYCEEFIHFFGRGHWQAGEIVAEDDVDDPHEFEWLEWQADDDVDEPPAEPEPEAGPLDAEAVRAAGQAVLDAVVASRNAQRRRHMYARQADWLTAITEPLGQAGRCARLIASADDAYAAPIESAVGPDGESLLRCWVEHLVLAAGEAVKAAAELQLREEGGSDYTDSQCVCTLAGYLAAEVCGERPIEPPSPAHSTVVVTHVPATMAYVTPALEFRPVRPSRLTSLSVADHPPSAARSSGGQRSRGRTGRRAWAAGRWGDGVTGGRGDGVGRVAAGVGVVGVR